eukprot:3003666-Pyramimonas_sp.AAC.1
MSFWAPGPQHATAAIGAVRCGFPVPGPRAKHRRSGHELTRAALSKPSAPDCPGRGTRLHARCHWSRLSW